MPRKQNAEPPVVLSLNDLDGLTEALVSFGIITPEEAEAVKAITPEEIEAIKAGRIVGVDLGVEIETTVTETSVFEEVGPEDPRFATLPENQTDLTLDAAIRDGDLDPDCPLCQAMLAKRGGPAKLVRLAEIPAGVKVGGEA